MDVFLRFFIIFQIMLDITILVIAGYLFFKHARVCEKKENDNVNIENEIEQITTEIAAIVDKFKENYKAFCIDYNKKISYMETLYEEMKINKHNRENDLVESYIKKQKEVLTLRKKGMEKEEIAKSLGMSISEIETFLKLTKNHTSL